MPEFAALLRAHLELSNSQSSAARLSWRAGLRLIRFSFNAPREGSGAPRNAGACEAPGAAANHPGTLARRAASPCDRRGAPLGALLRLFSIPGHAFRSACAAVSQLLAGGP